jgi:uncharacterized protein YyaL (SSP411 family)
MPNRLAHESSPYLLQHANNPVDWYPWGPEALERSRREDKPIFLSIGYSACHWCHVMEHESFENPQIAKLMNDHFVCIKVDREERPDLDQIYMTAVQLMTGRGGWPMSVFLTPDLHPFYGGTYWPPTARMGMPGFDQVLLAVTDAWSNRREQALQQAGTLVEHIRALAVPDADGAELQLSMLTRAAAALERSFDHQQGGFGGAPKFPHPMDLRLLLRVWLRQSPSPPAPRHPLGAEAPSGEQPNDELLSMICLTLDKMAAGGMYDQLGGGFHRYSVDERWLVPHFEKMLYDNALLAVAYLEAFQATGNAEYERVVREVCDYVLREMTDNAGGFLSTQDADSEGEEGKFFVWTPDEIEAVLGTDRGKTFCYVYDVSDAGNFERHNILNLPKTISQCAKILSRNEAELRSELNESREKLFAVRKQRIHPGLDDKVIVAWNGLMIDALAQAGATLAEPRYLAAGVKAAGFLLSQVRRDDGRLLHTWRGGVAKLDAYLDDYAALANGLVSLYEATFDERWIEEAAKLADTMLAQFVDAERGGFFYTADDHEALIARQKDLLDGATPGGNSLAATALVRLGKLTGRSDYLEAAEKTIQAAAAMLSQSPTAAGQMLIALDMLLGPTKEIVLLGDPANAITAQTLSILRKQFLPNKVVALRKDATVEPSLLDPLFAGKQLATEQPTLFVCENFTCQTPVSGAAAIAEARGLWPEV